MFKIKRKSKRVKKNLKKFKNAKFDYAKFVKNYYIEKGHAYITAKVNSIDDIVSRYSVKDYEWINRDFAKYIEDCAYYIPIEESIIVEICGCKFNDEQKETIKRVIKDYFGLKLGDAILEIDTNRRKSIILLVMGIISLFAVMIFSRLNIIETVMELILIIFWFFIWEYGDLAIIDKMKLMEAKLDAGQLSNVKIQFLEDEIDEKIIDSMKEYMKEQ